MLPAFLTIKEVDKVPILKLDRVPGDYIDFVVPSDMKDYSFMKGTDAHNRVFYCFKTKVGHLGSFEKETEEVLTLFQRYPESPDYFVFGMYGGLVKGIYDMCGIHKEDYDALRQRFDDLFAGKTITDWANLDRTIRLA